MAIETYMLRILKLFSIFELVDKQSFGIWMFVLKEVRRSDIFAGEWSES